MTKRLSRFIDTDKWLVPLFWSAVMGYIFAYLPLKDGAIRSSNTALLLFLAIVLVGYALSQLAFRNFVDEVFDEGDYLLVRRRGMEDRIPLTNIESVRKAMYRRPPRVTLVLRHPTHFGATIVYAPAVGSWISTDYLIERIEQAQSHHAA
jgi:hypothetical protein